MSIKENNTKFFLLFGFLCSTILLLSCGATSIVQPDTPTPTITFTFTIASTQTPSPTFTRTPRPTRTPTSTPEATQTRALPADTPLSVWNHIPIRSDAIAGKEELEGYVYTYTTEVDQDLVLDYYLQRLPARGWDVNLVSPNTEGGYIIHREGYIDFIYIFEDKERSVTFVEMLLSFSSPSLNP